MGLVGWGDGAAFEASVVSVPATGLYDALFRLAQPQAGPRRVPPSTAADLAGWLDQAHRASAIHLLADGQRLAQEAVNLTHLRHTDDWLPGLS